MYLNTTHNDDHRIWVKLKTLLHSRGYYTRLSTSGGGGGDVSVTCFIVKLRTHAYAIAWWSSRAQCLLFNDYTSYGCGAETFYVPEVNYVFTHNFFAAHHAEKSQNWLIDQILWFIMILFLINISACVHNMRLKYGAGVRNFLTLFIYMFMTTTPILWWNQFQFRLQ